MPSYNEITKPTTTYTELKEHMNLLLISLTGHLLINSTSGRLAISEGGYGLYTESGKPTTTYSEITKPS